LEVNESMKFSLLEFCGIKLSQSQVQPCTFKAACLDDFMGFLEDDLDELLTLDDAGDKELVSLILGFLLSEKNLHKRVDYWHDQSLFRYADSEKKSLLQLADKCFGDKLSSRTAEQTIKLFERLESRSLDQQGIKKLERAFYILMNSEDKLPEASFKHPVASLNERLAALASEEPILKDLTVEELKDLLVFIGSAKFDHQQLSKEASFVDDNQLLTDMVVGRANVIFEKLSSNTQRDSEMLDQYIRINCRRMKALLASRTAFQRQVLTSDLHKPAFDLILDAAFDSTKPQAAEETLACCSDIYRLVQMTTAFIDLGK
jgi:hypothetical protein